VYELCTGVGSFLREIRSYLECLHLWDSESLIWAKKSGIVADWRERDLLYAKNYAKIYTIPEPQRTNFISLYKDIFPDLDIRCEQQIDLLISIFLGETESLFNRCSDGLFEGQDSILRDWINAAFPKATLNMEYF
jgi:hypothetical protein